MSKSPDGIIRDNIIIEEIKISYTDKSFYEILGVERTASQEEVRAAFKQRALIWHPDKGTEQGFNMENPVIKAAINERFRELKRVNDILKDPARRARYDERLNKQSPEPKKQARSAQPEVTPTIAECNEQLANLISLAELPNLESQIGHKNAVTFQTLVKEIQKTVKEKPLEQGEQNIKEFEDQLKKLVQWSQEPERLKDATKATSKLKSFCKMIAYLCTGKKGKYEEAKREFSAGISTKQLEKVTTWQDKVTQMKAQAKSGMPRLL